MASETAMRRVAQVGAGITAFLALAFSSFSASVFVGLHYQSESASQAWMDEMRTEGVRLATFTIEFDWTQNGKKLSNWRCVSTQYFRDYDQREKISQPEVFARINASGLSAKLEQVALSRAKTRNWFEYPRQQDGTGYVVILLADIYRELQAHAPSLYGAYDPGTTPLMHASLLGDVGRVRKLLSDGADVNATSPDGSTALIYAAASNNPAVLQTLLSKGAEVNARIKPSGTALTTAVLTNHSEDVEILLKAGADPNSTDAEGDTALKIATENHYDDIAAMLIKAGARLR